MELGKYLSVVIASTVKFIGGPLAGVTLGLPWLQTAGCTTLGMMLSVVIVTYAGTALQAIIDRYRPTPPRRFTPRTRLAIRIWKRAGMAGIALLTPLILTPIGGTVLAVSFRVKRPRLLLYMFASGLFWAIVQTLAIYQIPGLQNVFFR